MNDLYSLEEKYYQVEKEKDDIYLTTKQYAVLCYLISISHEDYGDNNNPHYYVYENEFTTAEISKETRIDKKTILTAMDILTGKEMNKVQERQIKAECKKIVDEQQQREMEKITYKPWSEEKYQQCYGLIFNRCRKEFLQSHTYLQEEKDAFRDRKYYKIKIPDTWIPLTQNTLFQLLQEKNGGLYLYVLGYLYIQYYTAMTTRTNKNERYTFTINEIVNRFSNDHHTDTLQFYKRVIEGLMGKGLINFSKPIVKTNPHNGKRYYLYTMIDMNLDAIDGLYIPDEDWDLSSHKKELPPHTKRELEKFKKMQRDKRRKEYEQK